MANRNISDLYGPIQPLFQKLLDEAQKLKPGWTAFVTDGLRTHEDQAQLYAEGRGSFTYNGKVYHQKGSSIVTNAKPGYSFHEYGLAVDIGWKQFNILSYDKLDKLGPIARTLGFKWGADFGDKPHFEYSGGLSIEQVKAGQRPKVDNNIPPVQNIPMLGTRNPDFFQEKGSAGIYFRWYNFLIPIHTDEDKKLYFGDKVVPLMVDKLSDAGLVVDTLEAALKTCQANDKVWKFKVDVQSVLDKY